MKFFWILSIASMVGCVTPYLGDATITPLNHNGENNSLQLGVGNITYQHFPNESLFYGAQGNYSKRKNTIQDFAYRMQESQFASGRAFLGIQEKFLSGSSCIYMLGGVGIGFTHFKETNASKFQNLARDYTTTRFNSPFKMVFASGGIRIRANQLTIRGLNRNFEFNTPVVGSYLLHGGIKTIYFQKENLEIIKNGLDSSGASKFFGNAQNIPNIHPITAQIGIARYFVLEDFDVYWDFTLNVGNSMMSRGALRIGLGYRF